MIIKKMSTMKMLEKLVWGRVESMEFYDVGNFYKNIKLSQTRLGIYDNGVTIKLSHDLLNNAQWSFVDKHKTFMEAYADSESQQKLIACMHGEKVIIVHAETGMESILLQQFLDISFQDLIEDKYWASFNDEDRFTVKVVDQSEFFNGFTFLVALEKLLLSDSHYMMQYHTDKKIYVDEHGIKDAETDDLLELDASLHEAGHWYVGELIGNDGSLTIVDALSYIDWNNQELVFGEGTEDEFVISTREIYEDIDLGDVLPEYAQDVNIKQLFTQLVWKVRNKTL